MRWNRDGYFVCDSITKQDLPTAAHLIIDCTDWGKGQQSGVETLAECIANSAWAFGVYREEGGLAGFARIISDKRTFGYLCDVVIDPEERGKGLGKFLVACITEHPEINKIGTLFLMTPDAQGLYGQFGFKTPAHSEMLMYINQS